MSLDLEGLLSLHATVPSTGIEKETRLQELARHVPELVAGLREATALWENWRTDAIEETDRAENLTSQVAEWIDKHQRLLAERDRARSVAARLEQELAEADRVIAEQNRIVFDPVSDYYGEIRVQFEGLQQNLAEVSR